MIILGIESSCDDTAAAVLDRGGGVLSSVVSSQVSFHAPYGGVVPEIAARHHLEFTEPIVHRALAEAGRGLEQIEGIAVTCGPGLVGSLLVGLSVARGLALSRNIPVVGVNHLEGHIMSGWLERPELPFPALALVVSGGHTALWLASAPGDYRQIARTRDDAAGEAFDKVAKLLGLAYPGGPVIDRLAPLGTVSGAMFGEVRIKGELAFSFSGYKTAARAHMEKTGLKPLRHPDEEPPPGMLDMIASFRYAVVRELMRRTRTALEREKPAALVLAGGVAANSLLREEMAALAACAGLPLSIPAFRFCADNAAMIALAGRRRLLAGKDDLDTLDAVAALPLGGPEALRTSRRHL